MATGAALCVGLSDGRWHGQHGPIDVVVGAEGDANAVHTAHAAAQARFAGVLAELVAELPTLRQPVDPTAGCPVSGPIARRMWHACAPLSTVFITPMAAVAGAVAQELIGYYQRPGISRAWVNNGGDIALHLAGDAEVSVGLFADLARFDAAAAAQAAQGHLPLDGRFTVRARDPVRGIATSGWRGRSFSLGIADSVTVLAATAAQADAAATVIANAVNVDAPGIQRRPAHELRDDTDLGRLPVTVQVPPLPAELVAQALAHGLAEGRRVQAQGLVFAAVLVCQGQVAQCRPVHGHESVPVPGRSAMNLRALQSPTAHPKPAEHCAHRTAPSLGPGSCLSFTTQPRPAPCP